MKQPRMGRLLAKAFPNIEIVDAKEPLLLFPTQGDFDKGKRGDPMHCGFANCAHRLLGSTQAHFFKRYVYLDHTGTDGKRRVYRYCTTRSVFNVIAAFDRGRKVDPKKAFALRAPGPSETIKAQRAFNKKWRNSDTAKAIKSAAKAQTELRQSERRLEQAKAIAARTDAPAKRSEVARRVEAAKVELARARAAAETAIARAKKMRLATYGTGKAKPRKMDLTCRSGTGAFIKEAAAAPTH